jgi:hypothetical protein
MYSKIIIKNQIKRLDQCWLYYINSANSELDINKKEELLNKASEVKADVFELSLKLAEELEKGEII